jgi:AcrR family transcriptional regulator
MTSDRPEPRKLPRQARSRALYDAVLIACAELLEQIGPEFTLQAVAERAGVSPGSLYQYFPDRPSLIGALVDQKIAEDRAALHAWKAQTTEQVDLPELLVEGTLQLYGQRPRLMAHMVTLLRELGREEDVKVVVEEFVDELAKGLIVKYPRVAFDACRDAAHAAVFAILGVVRNAAQNDPKKLSEVDFRERLVAVAQAALSLDRHSPHQQF